MTRIAALFALLLAPGLAHALDPSIAATGSHVLVSKGNGAVAGWGSDFLGKLGSGRDILRTTPALVAGLPPVTQVAAYTYGFHFVARDTNGRVWTWGQNDFGQLGPRSQRNGSLPGRVQGLSNVIQVAASEQSSFALKSDGTVWVWGYGPWGTYSAPTQIQGLANVVQIAASSFHYFARRSDGTVWGAGWNSQNQVGVGSSSPEFSAYGTPTKLTIPGTVIDVGATINGGAAITEDGGVRKVWSWGVSSWGDAGDPAPRLVAGFPSPPQRISGEMLPYHVILQNGTLWRWGNTDAPVQASGFSSVSRAAGENELDDASDYVVIDTSGVMRVRSGNAYGVRGDGTLGGDPNDITTVPAPANFVDARWMSGCVVGVTSTNQVWVWGAAVGGSLADGSNEVTAVPRAIAGLAGITQVATGNSWSAALDQSGNVWFWGNNPGSISGDDDYSPRSTPVKVGMPTPISGVKAIAAGWSHLLMLKTDGTVWITGYFGYNSYSTPTQVTGLPTISAVAAGNESSFAIAGTTLYAWGLNDMGELGTGDFNARATPTIVNVPGGVNFIATEYKHVLAVNNAGDVYGWGDIDTRNMLGAESNPGDIVTSPTKVVGISNAVDVAVGQYHHLARRTDGSVWSWGPEWQTEPLGRVAGGATPPHVPSPVLELDSVTAIAAAHHTSHAIRSDGSVWSWGLNWASGAGPTLGDGTFAHRLRPIVVIRENGAGNLDTSDWFLDGKPGTPKTIPAAKIPKVVPNARSLSSSGLLNVDGSVNVRIADQGKKLGLYVTGLVPAAFLSQPGAAQGAQAKVAHLKADTPILVNLTPAGWTVASGQLEAFTSGTGNAFLGASGLLTNVNPASIPGARFCIGYGESGTDMISTGTISDFLSLEGASSSAVGLPCLLSGVYVDGPATSPLGSAVPIRAVVVGQGPTGSVRFRSGVTDVSPGIGLTGVNAAVANATFSYTPPATGEYAFGAAYGGDGQNPPMFSEIPLRHTVQPVLSATTTRIEVPLTSEVGMEVPLVATVSGNRPGGTVQFKRGGVNEGTPVAVVNDRAVMAVAGLAIGTYSFTAQYLGDNTGNQPSASSAASHQVLDVATSRATLGSSANPAVLGNAVTLTVTVTGTGTPPGTVTLREGASVITSKSLSGGSATFALAGLTAGVHVFAVDYAGDGGSNPATTSNAVFQQVALPISAASYPLTVTRSGAGSGTVASSSPAGAINCGATCSASFAAGAVVSLVATPAAGSILAGWAGPCAGNGICVVNMNQAQGVIASFVPDAFTLTVTKAGSGTGTVTSTSPASPSIACGATCQATYAQGTVVTLTAAAGSSSTFAGWSGACTGTGACTVTLDQARAVVATFNAVAGLALSTGSIDFGGQSMGATSLGRPVIVSNNGAGSLTITGVSATSPFAATHSCTALAGGQDCTIQVTVTPQAVAGGLGTTATLAGTLTVTTAEAGSASVVLAATGVKSLVTKYYASILGREPDAGGSAFWSSEAARVAALGANVNEVWFAMAQAFFFSAEYLALNRDNTGYVTDLYNTFFNRAPDTAGLNFWVGNLTQGMPREVALAEFMFSAEFRTFTQAIFGTIAARAEVDAVIDFYRGLLSRLPDDSGFNFWLARFRTAQCQGQAAIIAEVEAISSAFALSAEYAGRSRTNAQYAGDLYNGFLRRGGDLGGVLFWIGTLSRTNPPPLTREQLRVEFKNSTEFQARVNAIIAQGCL